MTVRLAWGLLLLGVVVPLSAAKMPALSDEPAWKAATVLELQGRYPEAFRQYHQLLLSRDFGAEVSVARRELRVHLLTKLAALAFELGRLEESWDLALQLSATGPAGKIGATKLWQRLKESSAVPLIAWPSTSFPPLPGASWLSGGKAGPYTRFQLGAYRDWNRARTQLDILLENGWVPFVEDRFVGKERLVAVFLVSRQASQDLKLLKAQGFTPTSLTVTP